jgi:hypothetical protein
VKPGAVRTMHAVHTLGSLCCALALVTSCTTSETDSIDLAVPSAKPPMAPMKPMPDMMPAPCMKDSDAGCPMAPMKPMPGMMPMPCMKDDDAGCPKEPMPPPKPPPP